MEGYLMRDIEMGNHNMFLELYLMYRRLAADRKKSLVLNRIGAHISCHENANKVTAYAVASAGNPKGC
jgi:hypothetical protein